MNRSRGSDVLRRLFRLVVMIGVIGLASRLPAAPRVELELCTAPGLPLTAAQDWSKALEGLDIDNLRIRSLKGDDRPNVETSGSGSSARYRVTGIIVDRDELRLPGGKFTMSDKTKLAKWLAKLKENGAESVTSKPVAFGLSSKQLVALHEALAVRTGFSTKGKSAEEVVRGIAPRIEPPVSVVPEVRGRFTDEVVADELENMSAGSALAAVVRPLGLVVMPQLQAGRVRLLVVDSKSAKESWPIGWPTESGIDESAPELVKYLDVEIEDTPLSDTLAALQSRLKLPILLDHNGLARHQVDLDKTLVTLKKGRMFYGKILKQALSKANLRYEVRVDEAERPFVWIFSNRD